MTTQEVMNAMKNVKRGRYTHVRFVKSVVVEGDTYTKTTDMVVRFVNYANIKEVKEHKAQQQAQNKPIKSGNEHIIYVDNNITFNTNKNAYYLGMATTKAKASKAHSDYDCNGKTISKQDYEKVVKPSNSNITIWLTKNINDIISIG